ncbi:MAG: SGNH/GDSL hydrolase family protein [Oscillospiraceae bacterium]|nr:SGNH/GDSL hydrolase family protein [Oscillospiraceae bacterium]
MSEINIAKIDKNFAVPATVDKADIVFRNVENAPFQVLGVAYDGERYRRLPEAVAASVSDRIHTLSAHTAGGRVRFATNSSYVAIRAVMPHVGRMAHFALSGSSGFDLYADGKYIRTFVPSVKMQGGYESVIDFGSAQMRNITVNFPLYSSVASLEIGLQETAEIARHPDYRIKQPVVFYGSSITQGGCASRPGNCYTAILARKLDFDHVNLGFSGSGKAEKEIAEYIAGLSMSVFVYDYDHNAPDTDHLEATHERMFRIIREKQPNLPIVILPRPKYTLSADEQKRLEIIKATYTRAKEAGDENVYFVDGLSLMAMAEGEGTVDSVHPNDLGFASMAKALLPLMEALLK